ncbi:MAG TPA: hypothetical protein VI451_15480, partial [Anaerolineales bacterium]|nr:hypothetical protein [Anaerolineales bacterium]
RNRSLGEGIIRKNGVRRGCTPPADTIFSGSYPLQVGELNGYVETSEVFFGNLVVHTFVDEYTFE